MTDPVKTTGISKCTKCKNEYNTKDRKPRLLSCLHSFCAQCLEKVHDKGKDEIKCLQCTVVHKGIKTVEDAHIDPVASRRAEANQLKKKDSVICEYCEENQVAESRCQECKVYLCKDCSHVHKRHRATKNHPVLTLQQLTDQPLSSFGKGHFCQVHEAFKLDCYCKECKSLCCIDCTRLQNHEGHSFENIGQMASRVQTDVDSSIGDMKRLMQNLRVAKTEGEKQELELERNSKRCIGTINVMFERLEKELHDRKVELLKAFNEKSSRLVLTANQNVRCLEGMLVKLETTSETCSHLKDLADDVEKLEVLPMVKESLQILKTEGQQQNTNVDKTTVGFAAANEDKMINLIKSLGKAFEEKPPVVSNDASRPGPAVNPQVEPGLVIGYIAVFFHTADITQSPCDAIVSSAKSDLANDCGVGLPISKAAGPELNRECRDSIKHQASLKVGTVIPTTAGKMPSKHVLHAVRPTWKGRAESDRKTFFEDLFQTFLRCLCEACNVKARSVAFPAIATGMAGVPQEECASTYAKAVKVFTAVKTNAALKEIHFVDTEGKKILLIRTTFAKMQNTNTEVATKDRDFIKQHLK